MVEPLMQTHLPLPGRRQGKVRDIYEASLKDGSPALVIVASDRLSAFDVVMPNGIPGKGVVLTQISNFWFDMIKAKLGGQLKHHLISTDPADIPGLTDAQRAPLRGRVMIGRRTKVVPIECVVRGYLAGSGWAEYKQSQSVCGVKLSAGLKQCDKLPSPIFTPATKEETGHDENVSFERAAEIVGVELITKLRDMSLAIYVMARDYAATRGIIIADTKFEFGLPIAKLPGEPPEAQGQPILIDEVLTPDSSRFWPADQYKPGQDQPSFDKQYVRNYLQALVDKGQWNKTPPGPTMPAEVVRNSLDRYLEAYTRLTGKTLAL
ncbi:MAG: phosphoribosylaminoimidazolesuccinocarboxamide synthase [Planctomycetota bacterium]|nr:phosphoribosylaminoimidazolesuccinocarboxamide synthase [Planctomycetota bacterium]